MPQQLRADRLRVGSHVRRLRLSARMSQEQLAERAGNTGKHIGQIERGEVNVGLDVLSRIAAALSVDVADLFGGPPPRRRVDTWTFAAQAHDAALKDIEQAVRRIRAARLPPSSADDG